MFECKQVVKVNLTERCGNVAASYMSKPYEQESSGEEDDELGFSIYSVSCLIIIRTYFIKCRKSVVFCIVDRTVSDAPMNATRRDVSGRFTIGWLGFGTRRFAAVPDTLVNTSACDVGCSVIKVDRRRYTTICDDKLRFDGLREVVWHLCI